MNAPKATRATIEQWLAIPEERRAELIDGELVYQALRGPRHGEVQGKTFALVDPHFGRRSGGELPGGWWFSLEVDMELGDMGCRPDVLGWRRQPHPRRPRPDARGLTTDVPDWVCEVRAAPFEAIEIAVADVFGDDDGA